MIEGKINILFIVFFVFSFFLIKSGGAPTNTRIFELDLSENSLLSGLNYSDTYGVLRIYIFEDLFINKIKWNDFLILQLNADEKFDNLILTPKGDNKLEILANYINIKGNVNKNINNTILFPSDYDFPEWLKNTPSHVDQLIKVNTISINLSNYDFLNHFMPLPFRYTLGLTVKHNPETTRISHVYWLIENECDVQKYFTTSIILFPSMTNVVEVFTQYFNDDTIHNACSITVPDDIAVMEWLYNFNTFYQDSPIETTYNISLNFANSEFLGDFNVYSLNYEIHIIMKSHILQKRIKGYVKWDNYYVRLFEGVNKYSVIILLPLGNYQAKIKYVDTNFEIEKIESDLIFLPPNYQFPTWINQINSRFVNRITSKVLCVDLLTNKLPEELNIIEGFDTLEISIKREFKNKVIIYHIRWDNLLYSNPESDYVLKKIIITSLKNSTIDIGIFYIEDLEIDEVNRKIVSIKVDKDKLPLWLLEKTDFIESVFKTDKKLIVNLYNDELGEELNTRLISHNKASITVGLDYLDCCTIVSVQWNNKILFGQQEKFTIVKIYFEIVDKEYHIQIIYYNEGNKSSILGHCIEDSKIPKWFLDINS